MRLIEKVWFQHHPAQWLMVPLLLPLTAIFALLSTCRRFAYNLGLFKSIKVSVPVVVVGNIGIGGNGKTPLTLYLVQQLIEQGVKVGVVSRGYGSKAPYYPYTVCAESRAEQAGDEPLLIFQRTGVPVVIGADRIAGCESLITQGCEIIIADDGLQHYRLRRDLELIVVDGKRLFGNGLLLPAGPLRETTARMNKADYVIVNGENALTKALANITKPILTMSLKATKVINVKTGKVIELETFLAGDIYNSNKPSSKNVNAIAGIGDPQRFFNTLEQCGFSLDNTKGFIDHQAFSANDLTRFSDDVPLLMTEKDAVKCTGFAQDNYWYLPVDASFVEDDAPSSNESSPIASLTSAIVALVR